MGASFEYLDIDGDVLVIGARGAIRRKHAAPFAAVQLGTEHGEEQTGVLIRVDDVDKVIEALQRAKSESQRLFDAGV
ncbi:hypothetical protein [Streptomyces sp. NPDC008137]|uniref:hypothetical protein n=1 Tax=Streptomyces sp. NPDC008137 TaxID=3364813 RepID=UPI0036E178FB